MPTPRFHPRTSLLSAGLAAALALGLAAAGCVGESLDETSATAADTSGVRAAVAQKDTAHLPAPDGLDENVVRVSLTEYEVYVPDTLKAGPTIFRISNNGTEPHSLALVGVSGETSLEAAMEADDVMSMRADLEPGVYQFLCPVENHAERGMTHTVTVLPPEQLPQR